MMATGRVTQIIDQFVDQVQRYDEAANRSDFRAMNDRIAPMADAGQALLETGDAGLHGLLALADSERPAIAATALVLALPAFPEICAVLLGRMVTGRDWVSEVASGILERWEAHADATTERPGLTDVLRDLPMAVPYREIVQLERLDEREGDVGDIAEVTETGAAWCPNTDPPDRAEQLAWAWVIRPDLDDELLELADDNLRETILEYRARDHVSRYDPLYRAALASPERDDDRPYRLMTAPELLAAFREAAANDSSKVSLRNKAADQVHRSYKRLRETEEGRAGIVALMSDPDPHVRLVAAAHSLFWDEETARAVLEALRDGDGPGSFEAKHTLLAFEKGTLKFDY